MKKKNVLFLHLESISRANLWQYRNELGTVWRLMNESYKFNRFYTNSTSTAMSRNDLLLGDTSYKDMCLNFQASKRLHVDPRWYDSLENTLVRLDPDYCSFRFAHWPYAKEREEKGDFWVAVNSYDVFGLCNKALRLFAQSKEDAKPFCAYFWDGSSHLAYDNQNKNAAHGVPGRLRTSYKLLDISLNRLLSGMMQLGLWDDTIIIGFGDHGDDPWGHGLHRGYGHAISPYASQCWTPMFIYYPEKLGQGDTERLACTVDVKRTVLSLLFPDKDEDPRRTSFEGINLFKEKRDFVYSQNMFALQAEKTDPEKGMIKGYAITDGTYRLVATSNEKSSEYGGMGLYCDKSDPSNSCNLLRFLDEPSDVLDTSDSCLDIYDVYQKLKNSLEMYICAKEKFALERHAEIMNSVPEELAKKIFPLTIKNIPFAANWTAEANAAEQERAGKSYKLYRQVCKDLTPCFFPKSIFH